MTTPPEANPKKQICQIRLMVMVETDDDGLKLKKDMGVILADYPEAIFNFSLSNAPPPNAMPRPDGGLVR